MSEMKMMKVVSGNIDQIGYDVKNKIFRVVFKFGGTYDYSGVEQDAFIQARQSESIGKYVATFIKGVYPYKKVV